MLTFLSNASATKEIKGSAIGKKIRAGGQATAATTPATATKVAVQALKIFDDSPKVFADWIFLISLASSASILATIPGILFVV
jgi:hypothetical protein